MQEPLSWNSLAEAADWLTELTGRAHTEKQVLNLGLVTYRDPLRNSPPTCLQAAPPRDTKFGMYRFDAKQGTPSNPMVRQHEMGWQLIPLYRNHLGELLACGETFASIAKRPDDWDGQAGHYVLIEPLTEPFKVTLPMVGITGQDLVQLASFVESDPSAPAKHKTSASARATRHNLKNRTSPLDSLMKLAIEAATDKFDWQAVWAAYVKIAQSSECPPPLLGYAGDEGVKYASDTAENGVAFDTKRNFAARFKRSSTPR